MRTVILRFDGVVRNYPCESHFDALILQDALVRRYGAECVELWAADKQL